MIFATDILEETGVTPLTVTMIVPPSPGAMAWFDTPKKFLFAVLYVQLNLVTKLPVSATMDSGEAMYSALVGSEIFNPTDPVAIDVVKPLFVKNTVNVVKWLTMIGDEAKLREVIAGSASFCADDVFIIALKQRATMIVLINVFFIIINFRFRSLVY